MRILLVGDAMEDVYHVGHIERINPEKASAPLVAISQTLSFPGGAANVWANLCALGADVLSVYGKGKIVKNRVITADDGVVCRFDCGEELMPIDPGGVRGLPGIDGVVVSDYGKGSVSREVVDAVLSLGLPTFVDTKTTPEPWLDAKKTWLLPNRHEYVKFRPQYRLADNVLLKKGPLGVAVLHRGATTLSFPSYATVVKNTTGAGDTVIAAFAVAYLVLLKKIPEFAMAGAATFASLLAGISVASPYTYAPTFEDLRRSGLHTPINVEGTIEEELKK